MKDCESVDSFHSNYYVDNYNCIKLGPYVVDDLKINLKDDVKQYLKNELEDEVISEIKTKFLDGIISKIKTNSEDEFSELVDRMVNIIISNKK